MSDPINPKHYKHLPAEAIEIIEAAIAKAPSNQSAYLHGQVLKYLLRCWEKKGIEDLRKAKWYLDRLVASFDETIAEASGANGTPIEPPKPSPTQPPSGYRLLGHAKDQPRIEGDQYWSLAIKGWTVLTGCKVEYANQHDWAACRKIETPSETPSKPVEIPKGFIEEFIDLLREPIKPPPKRYRKPTQADLRDGPIECEVRDCDIQAWRKATLQSIYSGAAYEFQVRKHGSLRENRYAQCRIEVAE